jgi:GxxExxY protein
VICQAQLALNYKNRRLKKYYVADALCFGEVVVEFKASAEITTVDLAQLINYLKASGKRVGVLVCFGHSNELKWQRVAV